jgi:Icc-related predicted phosphoesterase
VAASGDVHCCAEREQEVRAVLAAAARGADVLLLAGDLTSYGQPDEAASLARVCGGLELPVFAVLGNHDWHSQLHAEVASELEDGGVTVLDGTAATLRANGVDIGLVGVKGFVGGFTGHSHLDDFGEPSLRALYRETGAHVQALDEGLREVALCPIRIVLLHYSPTADTLTGEPEGIWAFLGSDRLAAPILEHEPDLVLHGHAHAGTRTGAIGAVPVHNVSMAMLERGFAVFELSARERASASLH